MKRKVVAIVGTNGSGKSTLAQKVMRANEATITKDWTIASKGNKTAMFVGNYSSKATLPGCDRITYSKVSYLIACAVGDVTVVDCQRFGHGRGLRDLALMCKQRNWELHIVWVQADLDTCKKRVSKRPTVWKAGNIDQQFENLQKSFGKSGTWTKVSNNNEVEKKEAVKKLTELIFN